MSSTATHEGPVEAALGTAQHQLHPVPAIAKGPDEDPQGSFANAR